jgi:phosphate transport system substrate-binding protein
MEPTADAIADGSYPISRPLFFYVKKAQIGAVPGLKEYIEAFTDERAWGDDGYLVEKGLVPLPARQRKEIADSARRLDLMKM